MQTTGAVFERELNARIEEEIKRLSDNVLDGRSVKDFAEYRQITGQIAALKRVVEEYFPEVSEKINRTR